MLIVGMIGLEPIQHKHQFYRLAQLSNVDVFPFSETRMRFELIKNSFADCCLNHSATLSFAILVGLEPTTSDLTGLCSAIELQHL